MLSSGSSGSRVSGRVKTSGGGVLKRLDDATGIAGIAGCLLKEFFQA